MLLELSRSRPNVIKLSVHDIRWPVDEQLHDKVFAMVEENAWRKVKLDFRKVNFLTGHMLGKIVSLHKKLRAKGVHLVIQDVQEHVYEIFEVARLTSILDIRT